MAFGKNGKHKHCCVLCTAVWEHPDKCKGSEEDHMCPRCKQDHFMNWVKYPGDETPDFEFVAPGKYEEMIPA